MTNPIQVIARAMAVLESVTFDSEGSRSLREISADTGLKLPTTARIAQTLVQCGYLEQKNRKKGYTLGRKAYLLSGSPEAYKPLLELARPSMWKFHEAVGEYISLSVLHNRKRLIVDYILSTKSIQARSIERESPFKSLSGRILAAWLPEDEQRRVYQ
ncbi:MAG: helix-turn-helix domain-containing protein, partial [Candidatus Micrarchaeia archaeon]